jgi:hypothetical protein
MSVDPANTHNIAQLVKDNAIEITAILAGLGAILGKIAEFNEKQRQQKRELWEVQESRLSERERYIVETARSTDRETIAQLRADLDREQERVESIQAKHAELIDFARVAYDHKEYYKQRYKIALARLTQSLNQLERSFPGRYSRQIAEIEQELRGGDASQFGPMQRFNPDRPPTEGSDG